MKNCLVILAKTPGLSAVKTRLAAEIGDGQAKKFTQLCKNCLKNFLNFDTHATFVATAEKDGVYNHFWKDFKTFYAKGSNLGEKQYFIFEYLLNYYDSVVLVGMDIPQINELLICEAFDALVKTDYVLGPAKDGGFYLFGAKRNISKTVWTHTTWSKPKTAEDFVNRLNTKVFNLRKLTDADNFSDFQAIIDEMPKNMSPSQCKIVSWIRELTCYQGKQFSKKAEVNLNELLL